MSPWLDDVRSALDEAPTPVDVFFRDDDAGWHDRRLLALVRMFSLRDLPLDLAVIPTALSARIARVLRKEPQVAFHQHGYSHANHERAGRACEFGSSRTQEQQYADIAAGKSRLAELLPDVVDPIFTPPWNRCTDTTAACLVELELDVLSREVRALPFAHPALRELPVNVDWLKQRQGVSLTRGEVARLLASVIRGGGPVGLMFHHAAMDAASFAAAGELLDLLAAHPAARSSRMAAVAALTTTEVLA